MNADITGDSELNAGELSRLQDAAWRAREHARTYSGVKVGASALTVNGDVFGGCNIEHRFRAHDIHAEVNALAGLAAAGGATLKAVMVVSEETLFTPCGGCMDWIFEIGGPSCLVLVMSSPTGPVRSWRAAELMPHYPHR
jgi:cytidine deaminase